MELLITERKYAEAVQRYKLATNAAKVWVWDWDIQTDKFEIEQSIQYWLGYTKHDLPSPYQFQTWMNYVHSSDREVFTTALQKHLEGKVAEFTCEHRLINVQGQPHWFLSRGQA
ncbi:MAG: PAS domain-containing protein, partial [Pseudanabaena sp.]